MEEILKIEEINDDVNSGFQITTDSRIINLCINNGQHCCEKWGYLSTPDDTSEYIGAYIYSIELVDTALKKSTFIDFLESANAMFLNINTDIGILQFAVYNSHNGYYGHSAYLSGTDIDCQVCL